MIAYLDGKFVYKSPAMVHVDVNGVGYEVQISLNTFSKIQNLEKGILQTALLIREDAHILYGFFDKAEKDIFLNLISVSGIGATTARLVLELKDKLAKQPFDLNISPLKYNTLHADALNALMALGIARSTADQALQRVTQTNPSLTSLEDVIKKALKTL